MYDLKYYCKGKGNEDIIKLLDKIKERWNIQFESLDLSTNGNYDEKKDKKVYLTDFRPRSKLLKRRTGKSIYKELRGKSGSRRYYVSTPGTIALTKQGQIEWYIILPEAEGFLKDVLAKGTDFLEKLYG